MPEVLKILYQGQLPASVATLVTVGALKNWVVRHMTVVNNDTVTRTFALYRNGTTAPFLITPPLMVIVAGGMQEFDGADGYNAADTLAGVGSVASMLTLIVSGDEIS